MPPIHKIHWIHGSYHKCLTVYYRRVMDALFNRCLFWSGGYRHFNSHLEEFLAGHHRHRVASINNRALDLEELEKHGPFCLSRFVRDPRDLVVSGYFYHRRAAEAWTTIPSPTAADWYFVNGRVPDVLQGAGISFADYLQSVPEEEGLLAELEFRAEHFESMARWPDRHPAILTLRYEDILGREEAAFRELFTFYGASAPVRWLGLALARRHSLGRQRRRQGRDPHIRNPASGQWRKHFTPRVRQAFDARYSALIRRLGYPVE